MENVQTGTVSAPTPSGPARPTFLTVLCILTFIGSTWGIISGITGYLTANTMSQMVSAATEESRQEIQKSGDEGSKVANSILDSVNAMMNPAAKKKAALFGIVASVLTLLGGFLMFQLKKTGFYTYALGTLVGIIGPFVAFSGAGFMGIVTSSVMAFFGILFVVLYGLNLKYLK
jgi:hypothetical protein